MKAIIAVSILMFLVSGCGTAKKQEAPAPVVSPPPAPSMTSPAKSDGSESLSCSKGKEVRTLQVIKRGNGCVLSYTKAGKTTEPASSSHGLTHCNQSEAKIRAALEKAGFECHK